jgi:hypothetical protein
MNAKELLTNLNRLLNNVKQTEGILQLDEVKIGKRSLRAQYYRIIGCYVHLKGTPIFYYDDFSFLSNDLVHFTSSLFLLRPFINDTTKEQGTYHQKPLDYRYLAYASVLYGTIYKFWDRIGDLLNCFFETGLNEHQIYFGRVLNNFPKEHKGSQFYEQLNDLYMNNAKEIIVRRNEDAHNQSIVTKYFNSIVQAVGEEQNELNKQKHELTNLFKLQINYAYQGLELALNLIMDKAESK